MKLKKGSKAAKDYMAKIRAKRSKVGAPKKKAPVKKAAPKKAAKAIKTELKNKGLKLPHGYGVEKRARVGNNNLVEIERSAIRLQALRNNIAECNIQLKKASPSDKVIIRRKINTYKTQFAALKKYFNTLAHFK